MVFKYCPNCGSKCDKSGIKEYTCTDCQSKFYDEPAFCSGALISNSENKYLFLKRNIEPKKGLLGLPGGFVDNNESLEEALVRECKEEVGIELTDVKYFKSYKACHESIGYIVSAFFTAKAVNSPKLLDKNEIKQITWLSGDQIQIDKISFSDQQDFISEYLKIKK